jgi:type VI secretion system protein ImpF
MNRQWNGLAMTRFDNEIRITPSVLDRLIDYEPEISHEPASSRSKSLRQLKQAVRRDLEYLLNTRQLASGVPPGLKELNKSLVAYGLPDFSAINVNSPEEQTRLRRLLETTIGIFEPRLKGVKVTFEPLNGTERALRFRVDARLQIEPTPEPVTFDTVLQLHSGEYKVRGE